MIFNFPELLYVSCLFDMNCMPLGILYCCVLWKLLPERLCWRVPGDLGIFRGLSWFMDLAGVIFEAEELVASCY